MANNRRRRPNQQVHDDGNDNDADRVRRQEAEIDDDDDFATDDRDETQATRNEVYDQNRNLAFAQNHEKEVIESCDEEGGQASREVGCEAAATRHANESPLSSASIATTSTNNQSSTCLVAVGGGRAAANSSSSNQFLTSSSASSLPQGANSNESLDVQNREFESGRHQAEIVPISSLSECHEKLLTKNSATKDSGKSVRISMKQFDGLNGNDDYPTNGQQNVEPLLGSVREFEFSEFNAPPHEQPTESLLRQLGRRVSALPQLLSKRSTSKQADLERKLSHQEEPLRRYSMHPSTTYPPPPPPMPQPSAASVAGVGGTITTVTRSKRKTAPLPRLVAKNGTVNLFLDNIDRRQYVRDLFTTMIDIKWRYNLMAAAFGFVFSWLLFACIWYLVLYVHNDLEHEGDPKWSPCIVNVHSFSAALLFSIETQSTLGFGSRIISVECPGAIVIFCIQLIFGVVVECLIVGMVFAKLSRPAKRSQTIMYSKYATVCLREKQLCLMFRVGDVRSKSHVIGATIRASLVSQKITEEGEIIPFYHHQLDVRIDDCKNSLLLIWPLTVVHQIDEASPFYRLSAEQLANFKFEIITVLEGTVESTGQSIQVRSSYLPSEVKWGCRFEPIVSTHGYGRYAQTIIDYNKFNRIVEIDTPNCSAEEFHAQNEAFKLHENRQSSSSSSSDQTARKQHEVTDFCA